MLQIVKKFLQHPLTAGLDIDDPQTTALRRSIIQSKSFLRQLYQEWYDMIGNCLPDLAGEVVELGSGAGFIKERIPGLITTDVLDVEGVDVVLSPDEPLPFDTASLRAIVMTDVLHHIAAPRTFFAEATRTVCQGGVVVMVEPWVTNWSKLVYTRMHHEPFLPDAKTWEFPPEGPLSGANGALPWIMFERDRQQFETAFPEWSIVMVKPMMPFSYLLSGGVSLRSLTPGFLYKLSRGFEWLMEPLINKTAMFALIVLKKV